MADARKDRPLDALLLGTPSLQGPIHAFGAGCFAVFGLIYLAFVHSPYMFLSNLFFGALSAANWWLVPRSAPPSLKASTLLAVVYLGLVNVAVHLGGDPMPMVFWGMSVAIAAAFLHRLAGTLAWVGVSLAFYPLTAWLKAGPLAHRVIPLDPFQHGLLSVASYVGLMAFLAFSFVLFRRRLDRAVEALRTQATDLQKSESFLAESQQVARLGSYDLDIATGIWTASRALDELFGIDASVPHVLSTWADLVHPDERAEMLRYFREDVLRKGQSFDREYRLARREGGRDVWVHGRGEVFRDDAGRPVRMVGTIQDVSDQRRDEEERRTLEARFFHAQKLESLGVLAGGIAHDFNNLLTGILGNITLARSVLPAGREDLSGTLQQAETAALRAAELTHQMLAFSGKGQFAIQVLDLNDVLREMADLLRSSVPRKVQFRFDVDPAGPRVLADASQVRQVAMNLIINAAEAIGDQAGTITIRTSVRSIDAARLASGGLDGEPAAGDYAVIEVADTGSGMDDATRARLFEPFFTTKFTGRGLGLAAVMGIVRGHRGAIWVDSAPGRGTAFMVALPLAPPGAQVASDRAGEPVPGASRGRVLVVDDEAVVRNLAHAVLRGAGFDVLGADDGASALEVVRARPGEIDLVLLDLTMPRMDGAEVLAELRRVAPGVKVVMMSGYTRGNVLQRFPEGPPDDFLEKPFPHGELLAVVRRVLGEGPAKG